MNKEEWLKIIRKFRDNTSAMFGLIILIFFLLVGILAPILAPVKYQSEASLVNAKKLIDSKADKSDIIRAFQDFNSSMFEYYVSNNNSMMDLGKELDSLQKNELDEGLVVSNLQIMVENYVLDKSYLNNWVSNRQKTIMDLRKEIDKYSSRNELSGETMKIISHLEPLSDSEFRKQVPSTYQSLGAIYKKLMKFDPYILPIASWKSEPQPPTWEFPFGLSNGRNIYYGMIWGTRNAFKIGLLVTLISTLIGLFIGSIASYYGGWMDEILMRFTDIFLSVPYTLSAIVLTAVLGTGLDKVAVALVIFGWMSTARLIRGNILQIKNEQYVLASQALGVPDYLIIIKHILPNTIFPVVVQASMRIGSIVITAAALSFLGIGAPQGSADWGAILSYARNWMLSGGSSPFQYWYIIFIPGTVMVFFVLSWNLVGDALRDIFDPKMRI